MTRANRAGLFLVLGVLAAAQATPQPWTWFETALFSIWFLVGGIVFVFAEPIRNRH